MLWLGKTLKLIEPLIKKKLSQSERVNSCPAINRNVHDQHATTSGLWKVVVELFPKPLFSLCVNHRMSGPATIPARY